MIDRTVLLVLSKFSYRDKSLTVEKVKIVNFVEIAGYIDATDFYLKEDYVLVNCINDDESIEISNIKEVKHGDKVYVVTAHDGDCYGQFILGVFTEEPNKEELIKKYNEHLKLVEEDCYTECYIGNVFEIVVD